VGIQGTHWVWFQLDPHQPKEELGEVPQTRIALVESRHNKRVARLGSRLHFLKSHSGLPVSAGAEKNSVIYQQIFAIKRYFFPHKLLSSLEPHQNPKKMGREGIWVPENDNPGVFRDRWFKIILRLCLYKMIVSAFWYNTIIESIVSKKQATRLLRLSSLHPILSHCPLFTQFWAKSHFTLGLFSEFFYRQREISYLRSELMFLSDRSSLLLTIFTNYYEVVIPKGLPPITISYKIIPKVQTSTLSS